MMNRPDFPPAAAAAPPPEPAAGFSFVQMLPTLIFDVAIPIALFNVLTSYGVATLWALLAGGLSPALNNLRVWASSRRLEPLGIIVMSFLAIGTAASLISGSVFFALIKESFLTASFGLVCLGSLFAARPLMFYLVRQFVAGDDPVRLEWWNGLWQYREFRAAMRFVTAVWGTAYLVEALLRVGFALVLPPALMVVISPVMGFAVMIALIAWMRRYLLALRERRIRAQQGSQAA
jgi:intracellular septation protein A